MSLVGGLYSTKTIPNYMNTCVIDATILSIINSNVLCTELVELMRTDVTIDPLYLYEILSKELKNNNGYFNVLKTIKHLIGAYIVTYYGKGKLPTLKKWKNTLDVIRSHILFMCNMKKFSRTLAHQIDKKYNTYDLNRKYEIYTNTVIMFAKQGDTSNFNKFTFTNTDLIGTILEDNNIFEDYDYFVSWNVVRANIAHRKTDVYLRFPTYETSLDMNALTQYDKDRINKVWKFGNTYHDDKYICTDMILRQVTDGSSHGDHLVYYNLLECHMENNCHVYYIPPHNLLLGHREENGKINRVFKTDGSKLSFFVPEVLHFQRVNVPKENALCAGYIDEKSNDLLEGTFNLLNRLRIIHSVLYNSDVHMLLKPKHYKYLKDVEQIITILTDSKPNKEERIKELDYLVTESWI